MLFSFNNSTILALLSGAAILLAGASAARDDDDGWRARKATRPIIPLAGQPAPWLPPMAVDPEPAAGSGKLVVAAVPPAIETPGHPAEESIGERLGTFGSVAISAGKLPSAYKWRNATSADFAPLFTEHCSQSGLAACNSAFAKRMRAARLAADAQDEGAALTIVNAEVNAALRYSSDKSVWGKGDYWATPSEIAGKGAGDCEDFAIAKMWMLRSLGFDADQLQLVVLQDTRKGVYHAVLAVHLGGTRYILDNLSSSVSRDGAFPSYMPIMSFVGTRSYIHGFERKRSDTADTPKDLAAVMPGEGV